MPLLVAAVVLVVLLVALGVLVAKASKFPKPAKYGVDVGRNQLMTIPWSHYNELGRWALQRAGVDFDEIGFTPPFHVAEVSPMRGSAHMVTSHVSAHDGAPDELRLKRAKSSLPLVLTPNGGILHDSWEIAAAAKLGGGQIDAELRDLLDHQLAPSARILTYWYIGLPKKQLYRGWQADRYRGPMHGVLSSLFTMFYQTAFSILCKALGVNAEAVPQALQTCEAVFDEVGARLAKSGGPFMGGSSPSLGDFAFAALAKTLINPQDLAPGPIEVDPSWRLSFSMDPSRAADFRDLNGITKLVHKFRATPAGKMAFELYRTQRRQIAKPNPPVTELWAPNRAASPDGRYSSNKL